MSNSIIDYVFRALGLEYLNRTDIVQNPPQDSLDEENVTSTPIQNGTPPPIEEQVTESPAQVEEVEPTKSSQINETQAEAQEVQFITKVEEKETFENTDTASNSVTTVQEVLGDMMGDAPACPDCGHITIRNGSCYKCLNCGNSLGCS